jgi:hypothetical protein
MGSEGGKASKISLMWEKSGGQDLNRRSSNERINSVR